jgi:hypothetical protein
MGHGRFRKRHLLALLIAVPLAVGCGTSAANSSSPAASSPPAGHSAGANGTPGSQPGSSAPASGSSSAPVSGNNGDRPCGVLTVSQETAILGQTPPTSHSLFNPAAYKGCNFYGGPPQTLSGHTVKFTYMGSEQLQCYTAADKANGFEADNTKVFEGMYNIPQGSPAGTLGVGPEGKEFGVVLKNGCDLSAQAALNLFKGGVAAKGSVAATKAAVLAAEAFFNGR